MKIDHRFAGQAVFGLVELQGRALSADSPDRLAWMNRLAALHADESKYDEAEALFSKAREAQRRVPGTGHPDTLSSGDGLARVQLRKHEYVEAESTLRDALRGYDRPGPTNSIFHGSAAGAMLVGGREQESVERATGIEPV